MQAEQKRTAALELFDVLIKSWWTIVASVCLGLVGAKAVLHFVPKTYEASTMVRVAPPSIPERMINTTVTEDIAERLFAVQESILSRDYLSRVLTKHFEAPSNPVELEGAVNELRSRIDVLTDKEASMFSLVYQDSDAEKCKDVVNTLTRLYVDENAEFRARRAVETASTFDVMAEDARREKEVAEKALNDFKRFHTFETEQDLELNVRQKETTQKELEGKRTERMLAQGRLDTLLERRQSVENGIASAVPIPGAEPVGDPSFRRLAEAERKYEDLRTRYTDSHPAVSSAKQELERLREQLAGGDGSSPNARPVDPRLAAIDDEIDGLRRTITALQGDEANLQREIFDYDRRIRVTPDTQRELSQLQNAFDVANDKYEELRKNADASQGAVALESEQKGARLEVVEWAVVPFIPVSPKPLIVISLAIGGGLLLFVGPLFARTMLNPVIRSEAGLRAVAVGLPVLVDIPRIETRETRGLSRRRWMKNVSLSVLSAAALVAVLITL